MTPDQIAAHVEAHVDRKLDEAKPKWYHLTLTQLITILTVLMGGAVSLGWYQSRLVAVETSVPTLTQRVALIDTNGTIASQRSIALDHQLLMSHEQRLQRIEDVGAQLAVIREQISRVREDIQTLKETRKP